MAPKRTGKEGGKGFAWGAALASQAIDAEDARLMAVKGSIQESTFRQYASSLQPLLGFLSTVRGNESLDVETLIRSLTVEELTSFAGTCMSADKTLPSGLLSAIIKFQELFRVPSWRCDEEVHLIMKGAKYQGGNADKGLERGTLTPAMFEQLVAYTRANFPVFLDALLVQFGAQLRPGQLIGIKSGDFKLVMGFVWKGVVKVHDKRRNAGNADILAEAIDKPVWSDEAIVTLAARQNRTKQGSFPSYRVDTATVQQVPKGLCTHFEVARFREI